MLFLPKQARRNADRNTMPTRLNLQPCPKCGKVMNAQQRRFPCPAHIPAPEEAVQELAHARRNDVFSLVSQAIAKRGLTGPGTWSASPHSRFGVSIEWTGTGPDVDLNEDSQKPWEQFGGNELVRAAGYSPDLPLMESVYIDENSGKWYFSKVLPTCD